MSGYVLSGEIHGFANAGDDIGRVIAILTLRSADGFFYEVGQPSAEVAS
jgi:hypothetical protein